MESCLLYLLSCISNTTVGFVQECFMAQFFKRFMNALPELTALSYESCALILANGTNLGIISQSPAYFQSNSSSVFLSTLNTNLNILYFFEHKTLTTGHY